LIFLRPVETEAFEGLDDGEAGVLDTPERGAVCTQSGLTIDEFGEIIDVRALLAGSAGSQSRGVSRMKGRRRYSSWRSSAVIIRLKASTTTKKEGRRCVAPNWIDPPQPQSTWAPSPGANASVRNAGGAPDGPFARIA
jgi:hypothetical protein